MNLQTIIGLFAIIAVPAFIAGLAFGVLRFLLSQTIKWVKAQ